MTREDFLKKIELSDVEDESKRKAHQKRIMERVDQGIKIFGYEDSLDKQEQWYRPRQAGHRGQHPIPPGTSLRYRKGIYRR